VLRPSRDDPDASTMEVELLRLVMVPPWLRRLDPDPPEVLGLGRVAGLVPQLWLLFYDNGLVMPSSVGLGSGGQVSRLRGIVGIRPWL
jgi:hypothetical protein